jgi:Tol biopolymer transport system component
MSTSAWPRAAPYLRLPASLGALLAALLYTCNAFGQTQLRPFLNLEGQTSDPSVSPDGKSIAFVWRRLDTGTGGIYIRPISGGQPQMLAEDDDRGAVRSPEWSPDRLLVAFLRAGTPDSAALFVKPEIGSEERFLGVVCNDGLSWTADGKSLIVPSHQNSDPNGACVLTLFPLRPDGRPAQYDIIGRFPSLSPDGRTLAFVHDHEIRLVPVTAEGRRNGSETVLVRETLQITQPLWVDSGKYILYLLAQDRSRIRRIGSHVGSFPMDIRRISGEAFSLARGPAGEILATVNTHGISFWRIDLGAPKPHLEEIQSLPWNAGSPRLAPDGKALAYVVPRDDGSELYASNLDGTQSHVLFSMTHERIEELDWSPDGHQIVFTASPSSGGQLPPSQLLVISTIQRSGARRLLQQVNDVSHPIWARDGEAIYFQAGSTEDDTAWKLNLTDNSLTQLTQSWAQPVAESSGGKFLYLTRRSYEIFRIPVAGGPEQIVLDAALRFAVGKDDIYFERQDSTPPKTQGLNLYRLDLTTRALRLIANIGFLAQSMQLSPDGGMLYIERRDAPQEHTVSIQGLD